VLVKSNTYGLVYNDEGKHPGERMGESIFP
jgi:hypothetical protein